MADEGEYPKANGDIYYGKDANIAYYGELNTDTMNYSNVTIATSATTLIAANSSRKSILIRNNGSNDLYIGESSGVTTSDGQLIRPQQCIRLFTTAIIYGIADTSSVDVRYLEVQ